MNPGTYTTTKNHSDTFFVAIAVFVTAFWLYFYPPVWYAVCDAVWATAVAAVWATNWNAVVTSFWKVDQTDAVNTAKDTCAVWIIAVIVIASIVTVATNVMTAVVVGISIVFAPPLVAMQILCSTPVVDLHLYVGITLADALMILIMGILYASWFYTLFVKRNTKTCLVVIGMTATVVFTFWVYLQTLRSVDY